MTHLTSHGYKLLLFMAEVFLLPVAKKLAFFYGKCSEMDKRPKGTSFRSIADHFEAIKNFHFTAPLRIVGDSGDSIK